MLKVKVKHSLFKASGVTATYVSMCLCIMVYVSMWVATVEIFDKILISTKNII